MERDGFLDVQVPVFPVVDAHELFVLVGDLHRFQVPVECAVLLDQKVALAAVDP